MVIYKNIDVEINKNQSIKSFISQFQKQIEGILCIIDDNYIKIINQDEIPVDKISIGIVKNEKCEEDYFLDKLKNTKYCIFGKESAEIFENTKSKNYETDIHNKIFMLHLVASL